MSRAGCNSPAHPLCSRGRSEACLQRKNGMSRSAAFFLKGCFVLLLYKGDVEQVCFEHNMPVALVQQITKMQLHRVINHHKVVLIA